MQGYWKSDLLPKILIVSDILGLYKAILEVCTVPEQDIISDMEAVGYHECRSLVEDTENWTSFYADPKTMQYEGIYKGEIKQIPAMTSYLLKCASVCCFLADERENGIAFLYEDYPWK